MLCLTYELENVNTNEKIGKTTLFVHWGQVWCRYKFLITKILITKFLTHKVPNNKIPK
jgi:hypothetical protein